MDVVRFELANDRSPRDLISLGQLGEALSAGTGTVTKQRFTIDSDPPDDQAAFEFGNGSDDDDHGAAQRAPIDVFPEADELEVEAVEFVEQLEKSSQPPVRSDWIL